MEKIFSVFFNVCEIWMGTKVALRYWGSAIGCVKSRTREKGREKSKLADTICPISVISIANSTWNYKKLNFHLNVSSHPATPMKNEIKINKNKKLMIEIS